MAPAVQVTVQYTVDGESACHCGGQEPGLADINITFFKTRPFIGTPF